MTYVKTILASATLLLSAGCLEFPRHEARAKAKVLREKGYTLEAENLERKADTLPETAIRVGGDKSEQDPRNDAYHFPELQVPKEKRTEPKIDVKK